MTCLDWQMPNNRQIFSNFLCDLCWCLNCFQEFRFRMTVSSVWISHLTHEHHEYLTGRLFYFEVWLLPDWFVACCLTAAVSRLPALLEFVDFYAHFELVCNTQLFFGLFSILHVLLGWYHGFQWDSFLVQAGLLYCWIAFHVFWINTLDCTLLSYKQL